MNRDEKIINIYQARIKISGLTKIYSTVVLTNMGNFFRSYHGEWKRVEPLNIYMVT